jgi:hypothetical protein
MSFDYIKRLENQASQLEVELDEQGDDWSEERINKHLDRIEKIYEQIKTYKNVYVCSQ